MNRVTTGYAVLDILIFLIFSIGLGMTIAVIDGVFKILFLSVSEKIYNTKLRNSINQSSFSFYDEDGIGFRFLFHVDNRSRYCIVTLVNSSSNIFDLEFAIPLIDIEASLKRGKDLETVLIDECKHQIYLMERSAGLIENAQQSELYKGDSNE